jgi:hypothetical protein
LRNSDCATDCGHFLFSVRLELLAVVVTLRARQHSAGATISLEAAASRVGYHVSLCLLQQRRLSWTCVSIENGGVRTCLFLLLGAVACLAVQSGRIGRAGDTISLVAAANSVGYHAVLCLWQQQRWLWTCIEMYMYVCACVRFFFFCAWCSVCCLLFSQRCAAVNFAGATISLVATANSVGYHAVLCL